MDILSKKAARLDNKLWAWILIPALLGIAVVGYSLRAFGSAATDLDDTSSFLWSMSRDADSSPIRPVPQEVKLQPEKVALGKKLFSDPRLSADNSISCSSCHNLESAGADDKSGSIGITGQATPINSPSVFNSGFNASQFWDGRAVNLEAQAAGPVHAPGEMGSNWAQVIEKLSSDREYVQQFDAVYPDKITGKNIADAIATFERSLITPNAPFDRYLRGDDAAIGTDAIAGYSMFRAFGCISCHQGINIGGNVYQKLGLINPYFKSTDTDEHDQGRFNVTGRAGDRHVFKVPSLRNVARTAPYFHDGSISDLETAIALMGYHQLGRVIADTEIKSIKAFLVSLTAVGVQ